MNGFWKTLLRVDLTAGTHKVEEISEETCQQFLGGSGLGTKILFDEVPAETAPYAPENKIIFAVGPFQGTRIPGSAKWAVVSKSPVTNTFAVTAAGAEWGVKFKGTGFDAIVVEGKSPHHVYLWINNGKVELRDASKIWGRDAIETVDLVREELTEPKASVACIGPAGEKKVGVACISVDHHSFAGRTGLGAVMGSKNLKAIAVNGSRKIDAADPERLAELTRDLAKRLHTAAKETFWAHGTSSILVSLEAEGDMPIKYWAGDVWAEGAAKIGAPRYTEFLNAKAWPCRFCTVGCHRRIRLLDEEGNLIMDGAGAEYESLGLLGSCCLVDDLVAISKANDLCNRLGLDTISAGAYVGFTMECYERGLLTKEELKGLRPVWGDGEVLVELVRQIGNREGFGEIFAGGIRQAASTIGGEALGIPVEVKGLDLPAHDPRCYFSLAINYATSTRGACHLRGFPHCGEGFMLIPEIGLTELPEKFNMQGMSLLTAKFQDLAAVLDSLVCCMFMQTTGMSLTDTLDCLNSITGWGWSVEDLMNVGERIFTLQRVINNGDGIGRKDDVLPKRMFIPAKEGFRAGKVPEPFDAALKEYYQIRGWEQNGRPRLDKLREVGLEIK